MVTYGWTLGQVLDDLTLPQANMLFREMGKVPAPAVALAALMEALGPKDGADRLPSHEAVVSVPGGSAKFFEKLGIAEEERG